MNVLTPASAYLATGEIQPSPAPAGERGPVAWVRRNLLSSPFNIIATLVSVALIAWIVPPLVRFFLIDAVWTGADREACLPAIVGRPVGACWPYLGDRFAYFIYGSYPIPQRWRVDVVFALLALGVVWLLKLDAPRRDLGAAYFFVVFPVAAYLLLVGAPSLGLPSVDTSLWGGMLVSLVVATVGIVAALPLGVLLALGRQSRLPIVRAVCVVFIEFVRGVPLITVLFMASVMLPLFVPPSFSPDKLVRALVGVGLFSAAYMAEVVRGGLQAIPKGQTEGAQSLGLGYWQGMRFIILPQALRIVIPGIVNSFIALFKDTTLVFIVGIFDFLRTVEASLTDPTWSTPTTRTTGYAFAVLFYFTFCFAMSRYSQSIEQRLDTGHKR